jgi:hypothetical protein
MNKSIQRAAMGTVGVACALLSAWAFAQAGTAPAVNSTVKEQEAANKAAAASQTRVNQLDDETQTMLNDYRVTLRETESLRRYNEQLEIQIRSQEAEVTSINQQIQDIDRTNREIYPLMQRMIETLDQFVKLDVPFLLDERAKRIATLKETMNRADVSTAEKYRRLLEAYTIEMEYGRTSDAYEGKLGDGEAARTVNFLRIGRTALMYQTLDGDETGYWDTDQKNWVVDSDYEDDVEHALKVVRKVTAPDLIIAPVRAPEAVAQEAK